MEALLEAVSIRNGLNDHSSTAGVFLSKSTPTGERIGGYRGIRENLQEGGSISASGITALQG
jgi:hypothetical protein